jgi:hypothetical protein
MSRASKFSLISLRFLRQKYYVLRFIFLDLVALIVLGEEYQCEGPYHIIFILFLDPNIRLRTLIRNKVLTLSFSFCRLEPRACGNMKTAPW